MKTPALLPLLALGLLAGCARGPRQPLFGGPSDPEPPRLGSEEELGALPRPRDAAAPQQLIERLRRAEAEDRARLVEALAARGEEVRGDVEDALLEERVLVEVLADLLRRLTPSDPALDGSEPARGSEDLEGRVEPPDWLLEKYELARDRYLGGDVLAAIQTIDALLHLEPDTTSRQKLLRLRRAARQRLLRESVLRADLRVEATALRPNHRLRAKVELTNVSEEVITLRLPAGRRLGTVNVDYEELSFDGTHTRTRTQRAVVANTDAIVLGPGQVTALPIELPAPHKALPKGFVGRFHLSGRLRAQTMLVGDAPYPVFVPLFTQDVVVLDGADWALAEDPETSFADGVAGASEGSREERLESSRRAFVASVLMTRDHREHALAAMAGALEKASGPLSEALCAGLARATGEPLSFTRQEWLIWWKGRESRPRRVEGEEPSDPAEAPGSE